MVLPQGGARFDRGAVTTGQSQARSNVKVEDLQSECSPGIADRNAPSQQRN